MFNLKEISPKALDTLVAIIDLVVPHRYADRDPSLSDIGRLTSAASRVLRFSDLDERIETENPTTLQVAKKLQRISWSHFVRLRVKGIVETRCPLFGELHLSYSDLEGQFTCTVCGKRGTPRCCGFRLPV